MPSYRLQIGGSVIRGRSPYANIPISAYTLIMTGAGATAPAIAGAGTINFDRNINGISATTRAIAGAGQMAATYNINGAGAFTRPIAGAGSTVTNFNINGAGATTRAIAGSGNVVIVAASIFGAGAISPAITGSGQTATGFNINGAGAISPAITGSGQTVSLESETTALLARFGGSYSTADRIAINDFIKGLKTDSLWSTIDAVWIMCLSTKSDALLNWKGTSFNLLEVGTTTFTAGQGFTYPGSGSNYLRTQFTPSTAGGNWTQNSATIGVYCRTNLSGGNAVMGGQGGSSGTLIYPLSSNSMGGRINTSAGDSYTTSGSVTNSQGWATLSRTVSTTFQPYKNGSAVGSALTQNSAALSSAEFYLLGWNAGGSYQAPSSHQVASAILAAGWNATQQYNYYSRLQTLLTYFGAQV